MCGPLTVSCFEQSPYEREGHGISHHYITLPQLQVPCMRPGSEECKKKSCPLVDFQNPPTACSAVFRDINPGSKAGTEMCCEALRKYGAALHKFNFGAEKGKSGLRSWLADLVRGSKRSEPGTS